jgi:hypothetical protein
VLAKVLTEAKSPTPSKGFGIPQLINGILDGSLETFSPEELEGMMRQLISPDNLCSNNHEGLMQRLTAEI